MDVPEPPCGGEACGKLIAQLVAAAGSRNIIGMAKGLIMARSSCAPEQAFEMLRRASMRENLKLAQISERIVFGALVSDNGSSWPDLLALRADRLALMAKPHMG